MSSRSYVRSGAAPRHATGLFDADELAAARAFFTSDAGLAPTPLVRHAALARALGVADVLVKDESARGGLNAFKIVGVSYAVSRLVALGRLDEGATIVAATAGNHGRAVAHAARRRDLRARIYVPRGTVAARVRALRDEGAEVIESAGDYEQAVREAALDAERFGWTVVSDTSWPGYEEIPRWIMAGYTWIAHEALQAWPDAAAPDLVVVQGGVGGLVCGVAGELADAFPHNRPPLLACEPAAAASMLASAVAGRPATLETVGQTTMNGLKCAEVSPLAWRGYRDIVDAYAAIDDEWAFEAMRRLAAADTPASAVTAGASGACGVGTLLAIMADPDLRELHRWSNLGPTSRVLCFVTEGATDPDLYARVVGRPAP